MLDDASSALDYRTDALLRRALAEHHGSTTTVLVAQRISSVRNSELIIVMDDGKVLGMEEKPQQPKSHWAVPPFYIYLKRDLDLVRHAVENGCGKDAPGNLAHYMVQHTTMHAWKMTGGRFDIGSLDTYYEACDLARAGKI